MFAAPTPDSPIRNLFLFSRNRLTIGHLVGGFLNGYALLIIRLEYNPVNRQS
jgi:hypothetical protein